MGGDIGNIDAAGRICSQGGKSLETSRGAGTIRIAPIHGDTGEGGDEAFRGDLLDRTPVRHVDKALGIHGHSIKRTEPGRTAKAICGSGLPCGPRQGRHKTGTGDLADQQVVGVCHIDIAQGVNSHTLGPIEAGSTALAIYVPDAVHIPGEHANPALGPLGPWVHHHLEAAELGGVFHAPGQDMKGPSGHRGRVHPGLSNRTSLQPLQQLPGDAVLGGAGHGDGEGLGLATNDPVGLCGVDAHLDALPCGWDLGHLVGARQGGVEGSVAANSNAHRLALAGGERIGGAPPAGGSFAPIGPGHTLRCAAAPGGGGSGRTGEPGDLANVFLGQPDIAAAVQHDAHGSAVRVSGNGEGSGQTHAPGLPIAREDHNRSRVLIGVVDLSARRGNDLLRTGTGMGAGPDLHLGSAGRQAPHLAVAWVRKPHRAVGRYRDPRRAGIGTEAVQGR